MSVTSLCILGPKCVLMCSFLGFFYLKNHLVEFNLMLDEYNDMGMMKSWLGFCDLGPFYKVTVRYQLKLKFVCAIASILRFCNIFFKIINWPRCFANISY